MDRELSQGIGVGLAGGALGLFLLHLAPMLRDPSLRFPIEVPDDQGDFDAFVTAAIGFTTIGVVFHYTGKLACKWARTGTLPEEVLGG